VIAIKRNFSKRLIVFIALTFLTNINRAALAAPQRILSLAPSATEILFDLGLGEKVIGVTEYCTWPPEAKSKPNLGDMMHVNLEALVAMNPDIVIISSMNGYLRGQIEALGYPVTVVYQDSFDEICNSMLEVGEACGIPDAAKKRADQLRSVVDGLSMKAGGGKKQRVLIVVGRDADDASFKKIYVAGRRSFYDDLLKRSAAANAYPDDLPYASISMEGLIRIDPDLIIELVGDHGMTNVDTESIFAQWEKLKNVRAAQSGNVAVIRGDFTFRAGPRYPLILESFKKAIHEGTREIRPDHN
jgi:iron complex transport system substrate-binding protein